MRRVAGLLLLCLLAMPTVGADWPSFHGDSWKTGYLPNSNYQVYVDVWWSNKTLNDAQIKASPVLKDGILIIADLAGRVRALHAESGEELWNHTFARSIEGTPAIEAGRVYVVDTGGNMKALNLRNGRVEHTTTVGATLSSPTVHEGKLFIGTEGGEMKAYEAGTFTLLWSFKISDVRDFTSGTACAAAGAHTAQPIRGAPVSFGGRVFFGSMNHWFYAIDESGLGTGRTTIQWAYKTEDIILATPTIDSQRSRIYVGSYDGRMYAFPTGGGGFNGCNGDNDTIQPAWTFTVPTFVNSQGAQQISRIHSSAAFDGTLLYFGANNGKAYGVWAENGTQKWDRTVGSAIEPVTPSPAVANGVVVQASEDKRVYWLRASTGEVLRTFATQSSMKASAAIDENRAFAASLDGTVYMFGPRLPPRPDLVVTDMQMHGRGINVTIKNQGEGNAGATTVRIFRGGAFLTILNLTALNAGNETVLRHTQAFEAGVHEIRALVDPDDAVRETTESNNELTRSLDVGPPPSTPPPDDGGDDGNDGDGGDGDGGDGGDDGDGDGGDDGGVKIPAGPPLLALLAALLLLRRRT